MADGKEEREQREKQREQERYRDQSDCIERRYQSDEKPERNDS